MKPPIKVDVRKDNNHHVALVVSGADGDEREVTRIEAVCSISAFEAFHHIAPAVAETMNRMLAANGIAEAAVGPARAVALETACAKLEADIQALAAEKAAFDRRDQLETEKLALEEEVAEMREHDAWLAEAEPKAELEPEKVPDSK